MFQKTINNKLKIGFIQLIIVVIFVLSVGSISYNKYISTLNETTKSLNEKIISFHLETFKKLANIFVYDTDNHFVNAVEKDSKLRNNFEDMMSLIRISTIQNLFVVAKDRNNKYYFLLDSEQNRQFHANMYEPFDPLGDAWDLSYKSKKSQIYYHTKNKDLWITVIYPIVENNQTVALIGADISHQLDINMKRKLQDFTRFFFWVMFLSILFFAFLYLLTLYFRRKYYASYKDPLTQVYSRKYLYDIVLKKLSRSYQLFMIDIDLFKVVNDTYGHVAGDYVLQEVAKRIESLIRTEDSLIRYGGEEFLVYTTTLSAEKCLEFAERIRKTIKEEPIWYEDIFCSVTVSIGVNPYAVRDKPFDEMFIKADQALYEAKLSGRDCVRVAK
ncbi:sensor domain-containing diguanylate cyclase [Sulfurimonas sp.]